MKRFLFIVAVIATAIALLLSHLIFKMHEENIRLSSNQGALLDSVDLYRTRYGEYAASVEVLTLEVQELRKYRAADAERIRSLGIRLRRAESYAKSVTESDHTCSLPMRDTIIIRDTVRIANYDDRWSRISAILCGDTMHLAIQSIDTLHQVVHRVPRRFLFFRFGTKAIRQEIVSSNPHTKLVYSEYIDLVR